MPSRLGMRRSAALGAALLVLTSCRKQPPSEPPAEADGGRVISFAESEPDPVVEEDPAPQRKARSSLPEPVLRSLYSCWLESPYPYMFDPPGPDDTRGIPVQGFRDAGKFMAGIGGIMHYGSLSTCMAKQAGVEKTSYSSLDPVEAFAGMPVGQAGAQWRDPWSFNVQIVRWGRQSLIPDPSMEVIRGWTADEIYRVMFRRFFRLMAHSYLELEASGNVESQYGEYMAAVHGGKDGLDYLHQRYGGRLPEYGGSWDGTQWTPAMSFGFWLRRRGDATAEELWLGLQELLELYDADWLDKLQRTYAGGEVPPARALSGRG